MSDDRFKQARRSLIDRHNQRQQQEGPQDSFDEDFEEEPTALVDMNSIERKHQQQQQPRFAPPPNFQQTEGGGHDQAGPHGQQQPQQHSWQQQQPPPQQQPQQHSWQQQQPPPQQRQPPQQQPPQQQHSWQQQQYPPQQSAGDASRQQVMIGDQGTPREEATEFVNLDAFAGEGPALTPDQDAAGFEGNTQFVDIHALQAQAEAHAGSAIVNDEVLRQSYRFGPESIQEGESLLIFAQNAMGKPVILKRIWEGDPSQMPQEVRQRVAALDQIRHPQLVSLNGMLASPTGAWVELDRPIGYRLSDIILQNGPQDQENVIGWMEQAAEVLTTIHRHQFIYANLTPDAVWVTDEGMVLLEPFDILAFEHRGSLGEFGPPELHAPPEHRQVSPATDVYSLAAVTAVSMTGPPLNPQAVQNLDKKTATALEGALTPDPQERPQTMEEFRESFSGSGGLPDLDFKFLLIGVAAIGFASLGTVYYLQQQRAKASAAMQERSITQLAPEAAPVEGESEPGPAAGGTNQAPIADAADAPGPLTQDPRLTVETSFRSNPTQAATTLLVDQEAADAEREAARTLIDEMNPALTQSAKEEIYADALAKMAKAIRLSGGEPTEEDEEFLDELFAERAVKRLHDGYLERIDKALRENKLSTVKSVYPQLATIDASADDREFFNRNKSAGIKKIERIDGAATDEEDE